MTPALFAGALSVTGTEAQAAGGKTLTMKAARALALEESSAYFQAMQSIAAKRAAVSSAKKAVKMQKKDWATFRWSPLLNFKFPHTPSQQELYELEMKPITAQAELDSAENALIETKLGIYMEINNLYVEIVVLQRTIDFNEQRRQSLGLGIEKNKARLLTGDATQADIDALQKKKTATEEKIAADKRALEADLRKLGTKLGTDISTGYTFETPFVEAEIGREQLPMLVQYALDRNHSHYEACMEERGTRKQLETNYSTMSRKYGGDMNLISGYINQVLAGNELKGGQANAFKTAYDKFLVQIDSYWEGKRKILFIKVPKLWFKGSEDGTRFIQEEPEALYQNTLDYSSACAGMRDSENSVTEGVIDAYENYISVRNAYKKGLREVDEAEVNLQRDMVRNRLGELSFDEYQSEMDDYEELQNSLLESMKTYSQTLYAFDKEDCGGVSQFLTNGEMGLTLGEVGMSTVEKEYAEGAWYYFKQIIQKEAFELYICIPEGFDIDVTDFELYCDGKKVGERTEVGKRLRHLLLTTGDVDEVKVRLFDGDEFIDDVVIDPDQTTGPLPITKERRIVRPESDDLGVYEAVDNSVTHMMSVTLKITEDDKAAAYDVKTKAGQSLTGEEPRKLDKSFTHLSLIEESLKDMIITIYDESGGELYKAKFDTVKHKIKKMKEE